MRFNEQWLREWINPSVDTQTLGEQLTMAGLEVDAIEPVAPPISGVVVGRVEVVAPHPNAERLKVCQVNVGQAEKISIVCGASNVAEGVFVPTALVGAVLPNGFKIKKAKLRGVESWGMLCSTSELGLSESAEGLMLLPHDGVPGTDIYEYLKLDDVVLELGLTPNRGDCLSIRGIAREVATINRCTLEERVEAPVSPSLDDTFPVQVSAPQACPRYVGRVIRGVNLQASTPMWMQERLRRCGLRSIHPIVDVTNYILLELGQPMHAFDLNKLSGGINVRMATKGEKVILLDGRELELDVNTLVIADSNTVLAMAGVMGGERSSVTNETVDIFLESAFFAPKSIAGRARRYGLHTDSSHRFERGVDPELAARAMERASALIIDIAGGQAGPIVDTRFEDTLPKPQAVTLRQARITRVLGCDIPAQDIESTLTGLGMSLSLQSAGEWRVTPPSYRFDITIEADLIEEVARVYGYSNLPVSRPASQVFLKAQPKKDALRQDIRTTLLNRDYQEAITYSFVDPDQQTLIVPDLPAIALANPIASDMSVMRTSLWTGLLKALQFNQNRQQSRVRLYEIGAVYTQTGSGITEREMVAGVVCGECLPKQWGMATRNVDFFDVKGDVEAILALTRSSQRFMFSAGEHEALHPGQSALITCDDRVVGQVGGVHPRLAKALGLKGSVFVFQLYLDELGEPQKPQFKAISKFPSIKRDIAVVVDKSVSAAQICQVSSRAAGELLVDLQLFDIYEGEGIDSGRKSLALGLTLQDTVRTLKDEDVDLVMSRVLEELKTNLGASLRE